MVSAGARPLIQKERGLRISNVSKRFGAISVVQSVSIHCGLDEVVGLIGPNGAGKTTLINLVTGVLKPNAGTITLHGEDLHDLPAYSIAKLGVARTFQNIRLFKGLTVRENVEVATIHAGRIGRGRRRSRAERLLDEMGLIDIAEQRAGTLSYGFQRRVEIARALALDPAILLLDEPAAGANEVEADELVSIIKGVREGNDIGVLVVDHDLRFVWELSDRVYVLDHGEMIACGTPDEIRTNQRVVDVYIGTDAANPGGSSDG